MEEIQKEVHVLAENQFSKEDFNVFDIQGLDERMAGIRERIQPKFRHFAGAGTRLIASEEGVESVPVHIAKHLRRTKYAPENTWCAIGGDARGYKKYPHFQIGIAKEGVSFYLCLIDQPVKEKEMAAALLERLPELESLPRDYVVSVDHTVPAVLPIEAVDWEPVLIRLRDVKKAELLIGRKLAPADPRLATEEGTLAVMEETIRELLPIYRACMEQYR
ncbi:hypothetical protein SDC9_101409 [bioreactor metagenome]|uniref:Uncharacterized protein n=1 Tax=bioreactor metagenome TaxID=1076179 RepID=A0A645ANE9_9ZZZZ